MSKRQIRVVAAQIERDGQYLITQRKPSSSLPLLWEFPGGRVEENGRTGVVEQKKMGGSSAVPAVETVYVQVPVLYSTIPYRR